VHRLSPVAELAVFRVVQEALTNTIKHAGPGASAEVEFVWTPEALTVTLRDDGSDPSPPRGSGHGLTGMRERLAAIGGSVTAGPGDREGFQITAWLPADGGTA
jgi:signal transduction histidine kinase